MRSRHRYWPHRHPLSGLLCGRYYAIAKRTLDLVLCLLAMPLVLPLITIIVVAIRLDSSGSPIFTQWRTGRGGRRFRMYKFRTMVENAEELKAKYAHLNELTWPDFKIKNDPRVTRVGRILRKTSLDELPQVFNVLRGEMSLVGPRPISIKPDLFSLWHTQRLDAKPGLAGLWQVKGRGTAEFDARNRMDIEYVQRPCLFFDLKLLLQTLVVVLDRKGAY